MKMFWRGILICVVFWSALGLVTKGGLLKKRLCFQYEIEDYNTSMTAFKKLPWMTRSTCFLECVRHQRGGSPCRGFHFRQEEGICELLPEENTCMAGNTEPGTTYVHLSDCKFVAPYRGLNPNPDPLPWVRDPTTLEGTLGFRSPMGRVRYVVRVLHKGMWLTGFGQFYKAYVAGPDGVNFTCRYNIQYINSSDPVPYNWVSFSVGDAVPSLAIVAGYWPNGTSLYIIRLASVNEGAIFPASYNADSLQIRPEFPSFRPDSVRILVRKI